MNIISKVPKLHKHLAAISVNYHVASVAELSKELAARLLTEHYDNFYDFEGEYTVYLTYPLKTVVELNIKNVNFLGDILWEVAKAYEQIYNEELQPSMEERLNYGLLNRPDTSGKYKIWGHDLEDLIFEIVNVYKGNVVTFGIGS